MDFICSHTYLEKWGENDYHCTECKRRVEDAVRIEDEKVWEERLDLENTARVPPVSDHSFGIEIG